MELQDTRFMRFMLHSWIHYLKFRGASRVCAIFLNFVILILKLAVCGVILVICAPHSAAQALRNKRDLGLFGGLLYILLTTVCLVIDLPLAAGCVLGLVLAVRFVIDQQLLEAAIFAVVFGFLSKGVWILLRTPFYCTQTSYSSRIVEESDDEQEDDEQVDVTWTEADEAELEEIVFCQLFPLGEEMCLIIDHVEMCPDETAFIRVLSEDAYTPLYKRKVRRDKAGNRFIVFSGLNYYLDDSKTKPTVTK